MPDFLESKLRGPSAEIKYVNCLTFGETTDSFFLSYEHKAGGTRFCKFPTFLCVEHQQGHAMTKVERNR